MKTKLLFVCLILLLFSCRKAPDDTISREIEIQLSSTLTTFKGGMNVGFVNNDYNLNILARSKYDAGKYPVTAKYTIDRKATLASFGGTKIYSASDTISFRVGEERKFLVKPTEVGIYRMTLTFTDAAGKPLGNQELNFEIAAPDLAIMILRNGAELGNLNDAPNFIEQEGSFTIRTYSIKEQLEGGKVGVTLKRTGTSVELKNWQDGETKYSSSLKTYSRMKILRLLRKKYPPEKREDKKEKVSVSMTYNVARSDVLPQMGKAFLKEWVEIFRFLGRVAGRKIKK